MISSLYTADVYGRSKILLGWWTYLNDVRNAKNICMYNSWWCLDSDDDHDDSHLNLNWLKNSSTVIVLLKGIDIEEFYPFGSHIEKEHSICKLLLSYTQWKY